MMPMSNKKGLVVFLGAGASSCLGVPSTVRITEEIWRALTVETARLAGVAWPRSSLNTSAAPDSLKAVLDSTFPPGANFEHILDAVETIESLRRTWCRPACPRPDMDGIVCGGPKGGLEACFNEFWLLSVRRQIFQTLRSLIVKASSEVSQHSTWKTIGGFLSRLNSEFDLHVVTTNYDTAVEQALNLDPSELGFRKIEGEDVWRFDPCVAPAPALLHLHGCINFGYRNGDPNRFISQDDIEDLYWHPVLSPDQDSWLLRSGSTTQAGRDMIIGPMITGLHKTEKLLVEPYLSYFHYFKRLVEMTPRLMVIGCGLADPHIRAVLLSVIRWHGSERRVVFIDQWQEDDWQPSSVWAIQKPSLFECTTRWAEQEDAMDLIDYPYPWTPTGKGAGRLEVYLGGFEDTVIRFADRMIDFLCSR